MEHYERTRRESEKMSQGSKIGLDDDDGENIRPLIFDQESED